MGELTSMETDLDWRNSATPCSVVLAICKGPGRKGERKAERMRLSKRCNGCVKATVWTEATAAATLLHLFQISTPCSYSTLYDSSTGEGRAKRARIIRCGICVESLCETIVSHVLRNILPAFHESFSAPRPTRISVLDESCKGPPSARVAP
jgi:hypothetical protein